MHFACHRCHYTLYRFYCCAGVKSKNHRNTHTTKNMEPQVVYNAQPQWVGATHSYTNTYHLGPGERISHEKEKCFKCKCIASVRCAKIGAIELFANTHNRIKENVEFHQVEKLKWNLMKNMCRGKNCVCWVHVNGLYIIYMCRLRRHRDDISLQTKCILSGISVFPAFRQPWIQRSTPDATLALRLRWSFYPFFFFCKKKQNQNKLRVCHITMERQGDKHREDNGCIHCQRRVSTNAHKQSKDF